MDVTTLKLLLLLVMIVGVLLAGLLPVRLLKRLRHNAARASTSKEHKHISLVLCLLTCFSGGVFLATCFLHLFPELADNVEDLDKKYNVHVDYPIAELLSCIGFFLLFFIEEVVIMAIPSMAHGHSHGHHTAVAHGEEGAATKSDEANNRAAGGCCMTGATPATTRINAVMVVKETEAMASDDTLEPMLSSSSAQGDPSNESVLADGHCQKHCPLTVHRRHSAGIQPGECSQPANEVYTTVILAEPERCETNCEKVNEDPPILMKSSPHAHSHGVRSITFLLAISFHELIEGMAFGVQTDFGKVTALFLSLMVHKLIVAFSVGLQLARTHAHQLHLVIASMVVLSLTSPVGAIFGMLIEGSSMDSFVKDVLITFCQGLAVGTFLYVTFFEVLLHERDNEHPNLLKLVVMLLGFMLIGLLRLIDDHDHSHGGPAGNGTVEAAVRMLTVGDHDHDHHHHHHHHGH